MLRHAIAPVRRFLKVSHDVVRHPRLGSDAKILLLYVEGLPDSEADKPLSEHAARLGIKGRAYQRAKDHLIVCGFFHEWRWQTNRGRWMTDQLLSNVTLTREEASRLRDGAPPSARIPTVGVPGPRNVGGSNPVDEERLKKLPHPPPEETGERDEPGERVERDERVERGEGAPEEPPPAEAATRAAGAEPPAVAAPRPVGESSADAGPPGSVEPPSAELALAERVLLSLRHVRRDLLLGVREARLLADAAAEWLRRGVSAAELRHALTSGLPAGGVTSAVGFLRHRLVHKLPVPEAASSVPPPEPPPRGPVPMVTCEGPGAPHAFRPLYGEAICPRCSQEAAAREQPPRPPWRELVAQLAAQPPDPVGA
ncbi:hypothetical protein [Streptomyces sp. NPDC047928]|uniref:hypothetical protein n=1 Tax=unclassified Streptomyces TaxID=2593676 RepID=UPI003716920B